VLHAGLRLPWLVFYAEPKAPISASISDPPQFMRLAMVLAAVLCLAAGIVPDGLYVLLPQQVPYAPYSPSHVVVQLQLLGFAALVFWLMSGFLKPHAGATLDLDWLYRRAGAWLARGFDDVTGTAWQWIVDGVNWKATRFQGRLRRHYTPAGTFGRTWPTGTMAFWTTLLLGAFLIISAF
jgi:multicomponent Na+:H+ antiporter subunit D